MDEKRPLLEPVLAARRETQRAPSRRHKLQLITGILAVLALMHVPFRKLTRDHHCAHHASEARTYEGESLVWEGCGDVKGRSVECSTMTVPMDQFNATNSGDKVFTIPLIRMRGENATQNLLLNPGGPGGSGVEFMFRLGEKLSTIVGEGFHLLSFDPRSIGNSTPIATCYPDKDIRQALGQVRDQRLIEDSPEAYAFAKNLVQACADTMGDHGLYINTPETAADMNSILDAVGQKDMVYWGFSYGTLLGQTYAGLFPDRSKRVIIDGVVNQFDWFNELSTTEHYEDTDRVLDGFFDECIKAGADCPLTTIAQSKDELFEKVLELAGSIYTEPLSVYVNNTAWGTLDYFNIMFDAIFPTLYKPVNWYVLADRLTQMLNGNATEAFLNYGTSSPWEMHMDGNYFVTMNDGKSGLDFWPKDRATALKKIIEPVANASLFSASYNGEWYIKQQWTVPKTYTYEPAFGVKTAHPVLILTTTYDPICPLVSARSANKAFADSQIVEVKGYGHCSIAVTSICAAKHIRAFLYNGTVPASYTQCDSDGPYFVKPEEEGAPIAALKIFNDLDDAKIHMAQLELARDPEWPLWSRW